MWPPSHSRSVRTSSTNGLSPGLQPPRQLVHRDRLQAGERVARVLPRRPCRLPGSPRSRRSRPAAGSARPRSSSSGSSTTSRIGRSYGSTQPAQVGRFWPNGMLIAPGMWAAANASFERTSTIRQSSQTRSCTSFARPALLRPGSSGPMTRGPCRVDLLHAPEVRRRERHAAGAGRAPSRSSGFCCSAGLNRRSKPTVEDAARADRLAAERARAVGREDLGDVRQAGDPLEDALVELVRQLACWASSPKQVRPADVADEQEVAGEHHPRRVLAARAVKHR